MIAPHSLLNLQNYPLTTSVHVLVESFCVVKDFFIHLEIVGLFSLFLQNCSLSFFPTLSRNEGSYAVQMVIEDFPRQPITLTQTDGPQVSKATHDVISKIPIQFAFLGTILPNCYNIYNRKELL